MKIGWREEAEWRVKIGGRRAVICSWDAGGWRGCEAVENEYKARSRDQEKKDDICSLNDCVLCSIPPSDRVPEPVGVGGLERGRNDAKVGREWKLTPEGRTG